jgi:hypothetical protein
MTPKQLSAFLSRAIPARLPILITGSPGVGKTSIVEQAAEEAGAEVIVSHPAVSDPTDYKGLPWPAKDSDHATFIPFGELHKAINAKKPTIWFLDDLGQADGSVQKATMHLLLARRVNDHKIPDCVTFLAATNRRTDKAGVTGILEPVKSRFASIVQLEANLDDWCQWAITANIPATLIAFLRFRPELLSAFVASADLVNCPSPRTWSHLAKLEALQLPSQVETVAFSGAVGEGGAVEYLAFRKMAASLVSVDQILLDPMKAPLPTKPNELFAVSVALGSRANEENFGRVVQYATRLYGNKHGEFAALIMRDSVRRKPKVVHTDSYVQMACGPLGQLISGEVN